MRQVASQDRTLLLRRIVGLVLVVVGLALIPSIVAQTTAHRDGEGPSAGRADCGSWADPSELSRYRPVVESAGCAQAIGEVSRTVALRGSAAALLLVSGLSLLITARLTRWIWAVGLVAALAVIYAAAQPGGLSSPITGFLYGALLAFVVLVLLVQARNRRARGDDSDPPNQADRA